jgi:putative ABC transport system permease protein
MPLSPLSLALALLSAPQAEIPGAAPEPVGIAIERRLSGMAGLGVGDTLRLRALTGDATPRLAVVEAVFERPGDPARIARNEYEVRLHLPDLQRLVGEPDRVDRFAVALSPGASAEEAARWVESFAYGTRAHRTDVLAEGSSATFRVVSRFHRAIAVITLLASGIFLLCVMIIRVDERRRDMGVLRLVGVSRRSVFRSVVLEAVLVAALGTLAGAGLGVVAAGIVNAYYGAFYDTTLRFALVTPRIVATAAALGLALGVGAGALAALRLARIPPRRLGER